jgi:hypothetical protein
MDTDDLDDLMSQFDQREWQNMVYLKRILELERRILRLSRIRPEPLGAWVHQFQEGLPRGDHTKGTIMSLLKDLPHYIAWMQRFHDAYHEAASLTQVLETTNDDGLEA